MTNLNKFIHGAVLLAISSSAMAWDARTGVAAHTVYWAGASASTLSGQELAAEAVCDADADLFYVPTGSGATADAPLNDWALACVGNPGGKTGLVGNILVVKRDRNGSGVGVGPVQSLNPISFLTVNSTTCTGTPTPGAAGAPQITYSGGNVDLVTCSATYTTNAQAQVGTSDIEPDKFQYTGNIPAVDGSPYPYNPAIPFTDQASLAALTFNTPVTLALRNKLQEAQFDVGSVCHPSNAAYNAASSQVLPGRPNPTNAESEACMPSLSRTEINSLLTGKIVTWDKLLNASGTGIVPVAPVQICRRLDGSGTQATINALISSFPCDANKADNAVDIAGIRAPGGTVVGNSGSGDVANCLNNFNATANPYAIGLLSVEGRNTGLNQAWRFIKIDGFAPTLKNIHSGNYYLWAQQSIQLRPGTVEGSAADQVYEVLAAAINNPTALEKLNRPSNAANCAAGTTTACGSLYSFGQSGWLATPTTALAYDNVLNPARPVNAVTREVTLGKVNICQTPVKASAGGTNAQRGLIVSH